MDNYEAQQRGMWLLRICAVLAALDVIPLALTGQTGYAIAAGIMALLFGISWIAD